MDSAQAADSTLAPRRVVARRVSDTFAIHSRVTSVLVFGSVALGHTDERSDVDVFIICGDELLSVEERVELLRPLGGGWRSSDGVSGDPLWAGSEPLFPAVDSASTVDGISVEVHYQTVRWITGVLRQVIEEGAITTAELRFRPYTLAGLIQRAWLLEDKDGTVEQWRQYVANFPAGLRQNILRHFAPRLRGYIEELVAGAERRLGPSIFIFFLDKAIDALVSMLYALNNMYDPSEKRAERVILPTLSRVPAGFTANLTEVLEGPFDDAGALYRARLFEKLANDVLSQAQPYLA